MPDIITLTMNPSVDKSSQVARVVAERKLRCDPPAYDPGGGGINVARTIQRLGVGVEAVCTAGGHNGRKLQELLQREELDPRIIPVAGETRQNLAIYDRTAQQQYRFGMPGPRLEEAEWQRCLAAPFESGSRPQYIVASGSLPPGVPVDFYARLARRSAAEGIKLILDCSGEPLRLALEAGLFLIKPNLKEFHELIGETIEGGERLAERLRALVASGCSERIVVSMGAAGALAAWEGNVQMFQAPTVNIQSKIGAGDSTLGGMVVGLSRGYPFIDVVRLGLAAGAAAVMTPGSQLGKAEDAIRLFEKLRRTDTPQGP